ncbi:N-acetyltransferase 10-like, partial [Tropilaelaps mercedesae]
MNSRTERTDKNRQSSTRSTGGAAAGGSGVKRRKIDNRIRVLIENAVATRHRCMFVVVGQKARDQVVLLHHILSKSVVKARPSVLWCYKKNLGFTTHRQKRMKEIQRKIRSGTLDVNEQDPFELFIASTQIRYMYYNETHKILGQTFGMLVLQDFEAITPNILARTVETVEGGGIICILLHSIDSLKQLYTMTMDIHSRYRTEVHTRVVNRFNERFLLSLADHSTCLVVDDKLNILPLSSLAADIRPVEVSISAHEETPELSELKASLSDSPVASIAARCATTSQIQALNMMLNVLAEKSSRATVALTAARGRGKSAALGLAIGAALATGYCNIFVTAPSPENLRTLFEFIVKALDAVKYEQHSDYDVVQSTNPEFKGSIVRIVMHIHGQPRQIVQYIHPQDYKYAANAELLVIDEAAAIPLPLVRNLMGSFMVFLSSTVNGYEGTGRSLSLKLIAQLRKDSAGAGAQDGPNTTGRARFLKEFQMEESIRYRPGDLCEAWLNQILCLDASVGQLFGSTIGSGCPPPQDCQLFYVNRDTLFSYHKVSEAFLQELVGLYVASHYKNSPNDLQLLSDAPAHHLFVLLAPLSKGNKSDKQMPQVLCVIQLCYEGGISESSAAYHLSRDQQPAGDLIPWTVAQQFQDTNFARLSGARIVRIATHPDYQSMGYGKRAMQSLAEFFQGYHPSLSENKGTDSANPEEAALLLDELTDAAPDLLQENIEPRRSLPPLLLRLDELRPRQLDYLGVSFGLTNSLFRFWKSLGFAPVYVRQTANELTGEHSSIMIKSLDDKAAWMPLLFKDFRKRFASLLGFQLSSLESKMASSVIVHPICTEPCENLSVEDMSKEFSPYDIKRLEQYCNNLADHHLIMDMIPVMAKWFFSGHLGESFHLSLVQQCILLAVGLQHRTVEAIATDLDIERVQCLGLFNRTMRKFLVRFQQMLEKQIVSREFDNTASKYPKKGDQLCPLRKSLQRELEEGAEAIRRQQKEDLIKELNLTQYAIKGTDNEWKTALGDRGKSLISIKSLNKRKDEESEEEQRDELDLRVAKHL